MTIYMPPKIPSSGLQTTGKEIPSATIYGFATFIVDRMHEQFTRMGNERVFKYSFVLYHLFLYYQ